MVTIYPITNGPTSLEAWASAGFNQQVRFKVGKSSQACVYITCLDYLNKPEGKVFFECYLNDMGGAEAFGVFDTKRRKGWICAEKIDEETANHIGNLIYETEAKPDGAYGFAQEIAVMLFYFNKNLTEEQRYRNAFAFWVRQKPIEAIVWWQGQLAKAKRIKTK